MSMHTYQPHLKVVLIPGVNAKACDPMLLSRYPETDNMLISGVNAVLYI